MSEIGILIIDDDARSHTALKHVLDSEGWRVQVAPLASEAMAALAAGGWTLVIVNVAMSDLKGPLFTTLKELAQAPAYGGGRRRVRVLFLVPVLVAEGAQPVLERAHLPFTLKPFHLHDFLEKVSDLLLEAGAIEAPLRAALREPPKAPPRKSKRLRTPTERPAPEMFASREDYQMSEEEITEWERQEEAERQKKKKKPAQEF